MQTSASSLAEASGLARVAVCNHVNVLYVPGAGGLETVVLGTVTSASLVPNQTDAILERLDSMEKTLVAGSKQLDPACVRSKLGAQFDAPQPTMEVARAFARRPDLKLVLDRQQAVATTVRVKATVWASPGGLCREWPGGRVGARGLRVGVTVVRRAGREGGSVGRGREEGHDPGA